MRELRPATGKGLVTAGQRGEVMRQGNVSSVLRAVLAYGPAARADIVRFTGLSAPSVTKLTATLLDAGLLEELAPMETTFGRPRLPLQVATNGVAAVGVHIGLLRTTIGLVAPDGTLIARRVLAHDDHSPEGLAPERLADQAADGVTALLKDRLAGRRLAGVGVSIGGWVDDGRGVVLEHGPLGWTDVPLAEMLGARLADAGVAGPVLVEQSVRAHARAELWFGVGREVDDFVLVFVGNVVGAAIVVDRVIHRGPGFAAGGLDHLNVVGPGEESAARCECCGTGCFSVVATDAALVDEAVAAGVIAPDTGTGDWLGLERLIAAGRSADASRGDERARELLRRRARHTGRAISTVVDLLDPSRLVLAGGVLTADEYLDDLRDEVAARTHRGADGVARIVPTTFGSGALVLASASPVLERLITAPFSTLGITGHEDAA